MVNVRLTSYPTASNDTVKASIERFFDKVALGERAVISDNAIIEQFRNVDINRSNIKDGINDLLIARDKILEMFYRDIGVRMYNPKKAQVNEEEITSNDQLLLISTKDMLQEQKAGFERVNAHWNTNINVEISDEFKPDVEGVERYVENQE
jgi:predicted nucleic-acid-binding protein